MYQRPILLASGHEGPFLDAGVVASLPGLDSVSQAGPALAAAV